MSAVVPLVEGRRARIVVIDDEPANTRLLEAILEDWGFTSIVSVNDPERAVEACARTSPDLVMLDLRMPRLNGFEVLELLQPWVQANPPVPVIVLTADTTRGTRRRALAAGARDFITKPFDSEEVCLRVDNHLAMRQVELELKSHGDELEQRVLERTSELEQTRLEVVDRLAMAAEFRDDNTHQHAQRIGNTSALLSAALDLPNVELMRRTAPLHDIGKLAIPDAILLKPGRLTDAEFDAIKNHTVIGGKILSGGKSQLLRKAEEIALSHHERWDGGGYPAGLAGEQIPSSGRIVAVADVFDALTHERPYKQAWSVERAVEEISHGAGHDFDPAVVAVFETLDHVRLTMAPPELPDASAASTVDSGHDAELYYRPAPPWSALVVGGPNPPGAFEEPDPVGRNSHTKQARLRRTESCHRS